MQINLNGKIIAIKRYITSLKDKSDESKTKKIIKDYFEKKKKVWEVSQRPHSSLRAVKNDCAATARERERERERRFTVGSPLTHLLHSSPKRGRICCCELRVSENKSEIRTELR